MKTAKPIHPEDLVTLKNDQVALREAQKDFEYTVAKLVSEGNSYRAISDATGLSTATIAKYKARWGSDFS